MTALDELIAAVPYYRYLGLRADQHGLVLPADERHIGDHSRSLLHGGILSAFVEAAGSLYLRADGAEDAVAVSVTSDYLRPATVVDTSAVIAEIRRGRRFAHLRVDAVQGDERRLVTTATGVWRL